MNIVKRAFLVFVGFFLLITANSSVFAKSSKSQKDGVAFKVAAVTPTGELSSDVRYPKVQIFFTKPVVALSVLGQQTASCDYASIEPKLEGYWKWTTTSTLSFISTSEIIPQKIYSVKVSPSVKSVKGDKLQGDTEFSFHTEELKMIALLPGYTDVSKGKYVDSSNVSLEQAKDIGILFNTKVNVNHIKDFLKVTLNEGEEGIPFDIKGGKTEAEVVLSIKKNISEDSEVYVRMAKGASSDKDCVKTKSNDWLLFKTLKKFNVENCYLDLYSSTYANPIVLIFNAPLKEGSEEEIAKSVVTGIENFSLTKDNIKISGARLTLINLPLRFNSTYKLRLYTSLKDAFGRNLEKEFEEEIEVPPAKSYVTFKDGGSKILESQFHPKIAFEHQNILSGSKYSVTARTDNQGKFIPRGLTETVELDPENIPDNTAVLEAVDLSRFLTKVGTEYRGVVSFDADMKYIYRSKRWYEKGYDEKVTDAGNSLLVQVTDLAASVRYGYNSAAVMVTSLKTGQPVKNAKVNVYNIYYWDNQYKIIVENPSVFNSSIIGTAVTDEKGLAHVDFSSYSKSSGYAIFVEVKTDDDRMVFEAHTTSMWRYGIDSYSPTYALEDKKVTFMFTDRGLYKPGEKVSFKVIDRLLAHGNYSVPADKNFEITLDDGSYYSSTVYYKKEGLLDSNGCTSGTFTLPDNIKPGNYTLRYKSGENSERCDIKVQFFERLRFETKVSITDITYYKGDDITANIKAQYLGGGNMSSSTYTSRWSREPVNYRPEGPKFEKMTFGTHQYYDGRTSLDFNDGRLSADGSGSAVQKTGGEKILGVPYKYRLDVDVMDSTNQAVAASDSVIVHPARYYIGIEYSKTSGFPKKGKEMIFNYICATPDGKTPLASDLPSDKSKALHVELLRDAWKEVQQVSWDGEINTRWERCHDIESDRYENLSASATASKISVTPKKGGSYTLRLSSFDSAGNPVITERSFYVSGGDWYWFSSDNSQQLSLVCDKNEYSVGEKAQILLHSPLEKGTYMLTVERDSILEEKIINLQESSSVIEVEIKDSYVPVVYVTLSSFSVRKGKPQNDFRTPDIDKPKPFFGVTAVKVSTKSRSFDIKVTTDKKSYLPGDKATVNIHASKNGKPLSNADITLMAVDRGVIDLINYHVPDPVKYFYRESRFPLCVYGGDSRNYLMDPVTYEIRNLAGGDADGKLQERKNFDPTALFEPTLITDTEGNASCTFTIPDTLTAYRITAVGVTQDNFAIVESQMDVANPVSVRHVIPRKLRLDDVSEVGAVISNISDIDENVEISVKLYEGTEKTGSVKSENGITRIPGKAEVIDSASKKVSVKSGESLPLMFNIHAVKNGWVTVELTVNCSQVNEKVYLPLEIERPYIYETVTSIGSVNGDGNKAKKEMLKLPVIVEGSGSFYVQLDPTRLGLLHDSVNYVFRYPYGCMEQRSSKVLPLIAFSEYIDVFNLKSEVSDPVDVAVKEINSWADVQFENGGFPYWPSSNLPDEFVSARIGEIIAIAKNKGIRITDKINVNKLASYLLAQANANSIERAYYCSLTAYEYYVTSLLGFRPSASYLSNVEKNANGNVSAMVLLALTYDKLSMARERDELVRKIRNKISLTPRGADISRNLNEWWWSKRSDDYSYCLQLFSKLSPKDEVNDHLIFEILKMRSRRGYWSSTASTSRVMIAIDQYIKGRNLKNLDFKAVAYLNDKPVLSGEFKGLNAQAVDRRIKFADISNEETSEVPLEFKKSGTGDLYYTVSMKYMITPEEQMPRDQGICVYSEIYDVRTGLLVKGGELKEGNVYKQKVYISSREGLEYVALRVPVPAGCEILNTAFVTTGEVEDLSASKNDSDIYFRNFYSNKEIYDCEVQYFWDDFAPLEDSVEFMFRATRAGLYNTPAVTAECMYEEEIFGRSYGNVWEITK